MLRLTFKKGARSQKRPPLYGTLDKGTLMSQRHDPTGKLITLEEARQLAQPIAQATACLTLYNGPSVKWEISVTFNPNTYPFSIIGGTIKGTICGSPSGVVTGGSIGPTLLIDGTLNGGSGCAASVTIVGHYQDPSSYAGTYGFDGSATEFSHTTLYCECGPC
jgi:hypothetical protein